MHWLVYAVACFAAGVASGVVAFLLTDRLREGTLLTSLTGLGGGILGLGALLLCAPAEHRDPSSFAPAVSVWSVATGSLIGRARARQRLSEKRKVAAEDLA